MDQAEVQKRINVIDTGIDKYIRVVEKRIDKIDVLIQGQIIQIGQNINYKIACYTPMLIRLIDCLAQKVNYNIIRFSFHASPETGAILAAIWKAVQTVINIVRWIIALFQTFHIIEIHNILYSIWPKYKEFVDEVLKKVSELSSVIGWGVDGMLHLFEAAMGGINVVGELLGRPDSMVKFKWAERGVEIAWEVSRLTRIIESNPAQFMTLLFQRHNLNTTFELGQWWDKTNDWITKGLEKAEIASEGVLGIIGELSAIQNNMPEVVRQHIPASIWSSLAKADSAINTYILPQIWSINRSLQFMNAILNASLKRGSELADKLAHPGEVLLGVDDLPDYVKTYQEGLIDDVTSREFDAWTNSERSELQGNMDEFDKINALMHAPTPEPAFLSMEIPKGSTIRGITAEPHETWFPGGLNDPR